MKTVAAIVLTLVLAFSVPVSAKYYRYVDENGVVRITDDIRKVPTDKADQTDSFESITPKTADPAVTPPVSTVPETTKPRAPGIDFDRMKQSLDERNEALRQEIDAINADIALMNQECGKTMSRAQHAVCVEKGQALAERQKALEEKQEQYNRDVTVYNESVAAETLRQQMEMEKAGQPAGTDAEDGEGQ